MTIITEILSWWIQNSFEILLFLLGALLGIISQLFSHRRSVLRIIALIVLVLAIVTGMSGFNGWVNEWEQARINSCEHYGLVISSPEESESLQEYFSISGTYDERPPEDRAVLFGVDIGLNDYYPASELKYDEFDKTWRGAFSMAGENHLRQAWAYVVLVTDSGRAMYDYYMRIPREKDSNGNERNEYIPFDRLPPGSQVCAKRLLTRD